MYKVDNSYINASKAFYRPSRTKIIIDGKTYDGATYIKDYPKFEHTNEKIIGGFPIKSATFSMWLIDGTNIDIVNKRIEIYKGLIINNEVVWIPQGTFFAGPEDVSVSDSGYYVSVKCYDNAKKMGEIYYTDNNTYPIKEEDYIKNVIKQAGFEIDEDVFAGSTYVLKSKPNYAGNVSSREIVSRYAEHRGAIALFSRNNKVQIKKPTKVNYSYKFYEYKKLNIEAIYGPIDSVSLGKSNATDEYIHPDITVLPNPICTHKIDDNPFLDLVRQERLLEVYNNIVNIKLIPFTLSSALDSFILDLNDIIEVEKKDKSVEEFTILSLKTENRIKCTIGASNQQKNSSNYKLAGSIRETLNRVSLEVDHNNQTITALASSVEQNSQDIDSLSNPTKTIDGDNSIYIEDANEDNAIEYHILGKSEQGTRTGRNLFNYKDTSEVTSGITTDDEGWITISKDNTQGTSTFYSNYFTHNLNLKEDTLYLVVLEVKQVSGNGRLYLTSYVSNAGQISNNFSFDFNELKNEDIKFNALKTRKDFSVITIDAGLRTYLNSASGESGSITFRISVLENTSITPEQFVYEPYGAMPSPDYPSEIKSINGIKNLYNYNDIFQSADGVTISDDGWITITANNINGNDTIYKNFYTNTSNQLKENTEYKIFVEIKEIIGNFGNFRVVGSEPFTQFTSTINLPYDKPLQVGKIYSDIKSTKSSFDNTSVMLGSYISFPVGTSGSITFRISVFEDTNINANNFQYVPYGHWLPVNVMGENLYNYKDTKEVTNGVIADDDGWITINGDNQVRLYYNYWTNVLNIKEDSNYLIILEVKSISGTGKIHPVSANQFDKDLTYNFDELQNGDVKINIMHTKADFSSLSNLYSLRTFAEFSSGQNGSITFRISVFEDTTITPEQFVYEPYKSQQMLIDMNKPNLFDGEFKQGDLYGHNYSNRLHSEQDIFLKQNIPYIFSTDLDTTKYKYSLTLSSKSYPFESALYDSSWQTKQEFTFTPSQDSYLGITIAKTDGTSNLTPDDVKNYTYSLYQGTNSEKHYELSSINDTRDELEVVSGQITERIGKYIFTGDEKWSGTEFYYTSVVADLVYLDHTYAIQGLSNYFKIYDFKNKQPGDLYFHDNKNIQINNPNNQFYATIDDWKNFLKEKYQEGNPVTIYYVLAEPQTYQLTPTNIPLYENVNHINLVSDINTNTNITYLTNSKLNSLYATKTELQITADSITSEVNKKVSTDDFTTKVSELDSKITQTADNVKSEISATYSTKSETTQAKNDAITSANNNTAEKLKSYSTTTQMNNAIEQKVTEATNEINLEVSKKVNDTDLTGANIMLRINEEKSEASIKADKISLEGYTTINNGFSIDEQGSVTLKRGTIDLVDSGTANGSKVRIYNENQEIKSEEVLKVGDNLANTKLNLKFPKNFNGDNTGVSIAFVPIIEFQNGSIRYCKGYQYSEATLIYFHNNNGSETDLYMGYQSGDPDTNETSFTLPSNVGQVIAVNEEIKDNTNNRSILSYITHTVTILGDRIEYGSDGMYVKRGEDYASYESDGMTIKDNRGIRMFNSKGLYWATQYGYGYANFEVNTSGVRFNDGFLVGSLNVKNIMVDPGPPYCLQIFLRDGISIEGYENFSVEIWASDKRLKENIENAEYNALDKILAIKHRKFDYKKGGHNEIGYIADELEEIDPNFIFEVGENKMKQPQISTIIPTITKAIQEQQEIINKLKLEILDLQKKVKKLEEKG